MMLVDGAQSAGVTVWQETVTVTPSTQYAFSCWAANSDPAGFTNYSILHFTINGAQVGSDLTLSSAGGIWQKFGVAWNSGASSSGVIRIVDVETDGLGNDFALDDISLTVVPEPSVTLLSLLAVASLVVLFAARRTLAARRRSV
jgi:hypothetical protein